MESSSNSNQSQVQPPIKTGPAAQAPTSTPKKGFAATIAWVIVALLVGGIAVYWFVPVRKASAPTNTATNSVTNSTTSTETPSTSTSGTPSSTTTTPPSSTTTPPVASDLLARSDNFYYRVHGDQGLNVWFGGDVLTVSKEAFHWYSEGIIDTWSIDAKLREHPEESINSALADYLSTNGLTASGSATPMTFHGKTALKQQYSFDLFGETKTRELMLVLGSTGITANDIQYVITYTPGDATYQALNDKLEFTK